jgi:protein-S-isoprenylcysteine O-methyltransferase Ste14
MEYQIYQAFLIFSFVFAVVTYVALLFVSAPYGRHIRKGWGPSISNRLAWVIMELPSPVVFLITFILGKAPKTITLIIFLGIWQAHYIHRAFIYPFMLVDGKKKMPILVMVLGFIFNLGNAYVNGRYLFAFSSRYLNSWLLTPMFIVGILIFITGFVINRWADRTLRLLREPGEMGYKVPYGGLFQWISCPNYFGEIVEWFGWAIATWSLPGLAFAVWTLVNLAPRAKTHHEWYHDNFPQYPPDRNALIPGLW